MYEAIFKRKSVRKFNMTPLDLRILKDIEEYAEKINSYKEDIKTKIYILNDEKNIKGMFKIKAPHYLLISSENKEDYLENAGYILEELVIYLTKQGIGTCWLGKSVPTVDIEDNNSLNFVIMVAFGMADEMLYRENITEFKRKDITEISNLNSSNEIIEAARLAPSAMNRQLWYFEFEGENKIVVYRKKDAKLLERMSRLDIGIALMHINIAAKHMGKNIEYVKETNKEKNGYEYATTCLLK